MDPNRGFGKRLDARWEKLAGDHNERRTLYLVRHYLYYSVDEWYALPWWQQRIYLEGLEEHKPWNQGEEEETQPSTSGLPTAESDMGDFAALGMKVGQME